MDTNKCIAIEKNYAISWQSFLVCLETYKLDRIEQSDGLNWCKPVSPYPCNIATIVLRTYYFCKIYSGMSVTTIIQKILSEQQSESEIVVSVYEKFRRRITRKKNLKLLFSIEHFCWKYKKILMIMTMTVVYQNIIVILEGILPCIGNVKKTKLKNVM